MTSSPHPSPNSPISPTTTRPSSASKPHSSSPSNPPSSPPAIPAPSPASISAVVAGWSLEFILRHPVPDYLAHRVFLSLPLAPPHSLRLRKTILLRRLSSDLARRSVSPRTLHSFDLIHALDPAATSRLICKAYCLAAVHCTLRQNPAAADFPAAVRSVWSRRFAPGLTSRGTREWRAAMESAVADLDKRKELSARDTLGEALDAVRVYLEATLEAMGPPFLQVVAEMKDVAEELREMQRSHLIANGEAIPILSLLAGRRDLVERVEAAMRKNPDAASTKGKNEESILAGAPVGQRLDFNHAMELDRETPARSHGNDEGSTSKFNCLLTPEVNKVIEALKTCREDLQMAVEDPLPDAINIASEVVGGVPHIEGSGGSTLQNEDHGAGRSSGNEDRNLDNPKELERKQDRVVFDTNFPSSVIDAEVTRKEGTSTCIERNKDRLVSKPSLMERNPTAHTYEWDECSITSPSGSSHSPPKRLRLPSSKRRAVSPLKLMENKRFVIRRKMKKWTVLEEDTLRDAVKKHGAGNWKFILSFHVDIFGDRTECDLKDKWRNMSRH